jgi:tripartite ATP-independent transporter DctM subunit
MGLIEVAGLLLALLLALLCFGVWIGISLAMVGWFGLAFFGTSPPDKNLFTAFWNATASWELAALPMFIWMGEILFRTKLSDEMFEGLSPWLRRIPGRLMHVNILACGLFGSVSGSSAATTATVAKVALPELLRRGYDEKIALGSLATAGGLGILIPPSITMVVYAVAADASIIRIFLAGFLPGFLLMGIFSLYIGFWALRNPDKMPPIEPSMSFRQKMYASRRLIPVSLLIVFITWVLITGIATATECAAYGVLGSLIIAWWSNMLTWENFWAGLMSSTRVSCMIMFILAGAKYLSLTMAFTGIPIALAAWVDALHLSPYTLILVLSVVYVLLGTALDGISMIVLTSAVVLPMIQKAGFDLIWFGIFIVLMVEIAEITPPVGFNLFVLQNMTGKDSNTIARASLPFFACLIVCIIMLTIFPEIVTWLPDVVMGKEK